MWVTGGAYQAWTAYLDEWTHGAPVDPAMLPPLRPEDLAGDSWARFAERIGEALGTRLSAWTQTLERELRDARDEFAAARALTDARRSLAPIRSLAGSSALPDELRTMLLEQIDARIASLQQQIDEQTQRMRRSGVPAALVEARLRTVRQNPLTMATDTPHTGVHGWAADPVAPRRRRIVPH